MKYAFMTMDIESLYDIMVLKDRLKYDKEYSLEEGIKIYTDLLDKYNIKSTLFLLNSSLDNSKDYLLNAIKNGHEIALHGLNHVSPLEDNNFKENIKLAKDNIENELNIKIKGYRAPCFGVNEDIINIIKDLDFKYDSSNLDFKDAIKSGKIDLNNYDKLNDNIHKNGNFYEYSLNKINFFGKIIPISGGAYIRLIPWFLLKHFVKKAIKKTDSYIFYVHPYELINKKLPKFKNLNFKEKLFLKIGRKTYIKKIEFIINYLKKQGFSFMTMNEYIK